jgi:hypothetical protein
MSMLKKLVPGVLGALLIASPVLTVTTAAAADQAATTQTAPMKSEMKSHHKAMKHHMAVKHHKAVKHHMKKHSKKAKKTPPAA